jgi:endonuclease YncB( thermonuclease family)
MKRALTALAIILLGCPLADSVFAANRRSTTPLDTTFCTTISFDDGDSFECDGEPIRVLGIDTPEISHPEHGIPEDQAKGREAAAFTERAIRDARRVVIVRGGRDAYGRTLAHVLLDGELLGVALIKAGLAYETVRHFGDNGLPEFALAILEAWKRVPKPDFEEPYRWRKKHQKKLKGDHAVSLRSASAYFSAVFLTTSAGSIGAGGFLSQPEATSQSRTYCLS